MSLNPIAFLTFSKLIFFQYSGSSRSPYNLYLYVPTISESFLTEFGVSIITLSQYFPPSTIAEIRAS